MWKINQNHTKITIIFIRYHSPTGDYIWQLLLDHRSIGRMHAYKRTTNKRIWQLLQYNFHLYFIVSHSPQWNEVQFGIFDEKTCLWRTFYAIAHWSHFISRGRLQLCILLREARWSNHIQRTNAYSTIWDHISFDRAWQTTATFFANVIT